MKDRRKVEWFEEAKKVGRKDEMKNGSKVFSKGEKSWERMRKANRKNEWLVEKGNRCGIKGRRKEGNRLK